VDAADHTRHLVSASLEDYSQVLDLTRRDIRPKNIFLTANGNIKLGSFKASKVLEAEVSYAQTFLNSPYYMTPELMEGKAYDCKVDIWAFGCVLFEACSLRPSFKKSNLVDLLNKVAKGKVEEIPPNYSKQLNLVYLKCMKRNPNERISARDLLKTNYFL
jgi:NIMA (never in mitosis gene a)-related kinase